jgi:OPT oligopeptide transporter protein
MPILSSTVFDNAQQPYNVSRILTPDFYFDEAAYKDYSRVFLPTTYILSYALQFAVLPALIIHTMCWYGKDAWTLFGQSWQTAKSETEGILHRVSSSSVLSRHQSFASEQSAGPNADNLLSEEDILASVEDDCDVPATWYILTGVATIAVAIFVVEA